MNLVSIRLITADITRLRKFYELVVNRSAQTYTEDFCELRTPNAVLALGSTRTLQFFGDGIANQGQNRSAIIEFHVSDVDAEFQRLSVVIGPYLVQAPTTMPWGNRSLLFRDPDGNLINFFTPVTAEAQARLGQ
ncbi:VOC family protein [Herbaspirillum sp. RV1423]|uniref:VOC family protein n=1 Tax=Herbaspirillum sp. RV1423 TaxID=1443993 RepID=UPI000555561A|nr:VOC family protein [Herbaspirillum sp. RV1423]